ncbi:uncharacterized protein PFL1_06096 [Pseudozyma flocculosa PF-1]|uniref:Uncharacterized protein n=1 Tax=Pseudozyma flocculosa PF-1 TaxID=1277687 RepID=A0A061H243_9BASI|nr:uncharacterized protein PFL1_06096 [Pseudozyma flocculosa PF-1]EPQ26448.1 hypothetical protein PFL1_06096 [Pseudozyma flocculosa PF-1]
MTDKFLSVKAACSALLRHAVNIGLKFGSFHMICHDFATQFATAYSAEVARLLLNHEQAKDTLHRNYTGGILNFNTIALWAGKLCEDRDQEIINILARLTYYEQRANGPGVQALAEESASGVPPVQSKGHVHCHSKNRPAEQLEADCAKDQAYRQLKDTFDDASKEVEVRTVIKVFENHKFNQQHLKANKVFNSMAEGKAKRLCKEQ